jgi:hypothetical protein
MFGKIHLSCSHLVSFSSHTTHSHTHATTFTLHTTPKVTTTTHLVANIQPVHKELQVLLNHDDILKELEAIHDIGV